MTNLIPRHICKFLKILDLEDNQQLSREYDITGNDNTDIVSDNNNNNPWTIFIVLSSWPQVIARVHSVHLMNCRTAHKRPSTLRPSRLTWAVSPPVGSYRLQPPSPFIIITQPESWYSFTVPRRVEGRADLGTAGTVHTARAQGCKSQWLCDKHNCPQRDSIQGPRALQSDMLPLDHCDLRCDVMSKQFSRPRSRYCKHMSQMWERIF